MVFLMSSSFYLMPRHPPRPTLFPYTTLFRSLHLRATLGLTIAGLLAALPPAACSQSAARQRPRPQRSEEHTSELQSHHDLVCRLLLEKKNCNTPPVLTYHSTQSIVPSLPSTH